MRKTIKYLIIIYLTSITQVPLFSQKNQNPINQITAQHLESYVSFLASPLLRGRKNGDAGLQIAAQYIASQASLSGLRPANGDSYFQPYTVLEKSMDPEKSNIQVITGRKDTVTIKDPFLQLIPTGPSDFVLDGEVVFAGYGIKADKYKYNDLDSLKTDGKIILVMDRAPTSEDGKKCLFEEPNWLKPMNFQMKLTTLIYSKAKAIIFVSDPKSGYKTFEESSPGLAGYLESTLTLQNGKAEPVNPFMAAMPKIIFISRSVADALLKGSGHSLEELQNSIDSSFHPHSFLLTDKQLKVNEVSHTTEKILNNVAGYIEGSDPVLKNEVVIFSGHYDHIGVSGTKVNTGADDNASGCAALLEMAEAFNHLKKKPSRSVLFLWVSGEEIGLYGSESYVNHPLFPLDKTIADLNMDMIGRDKQASDSTSETPMTGPDSVFVISDGQSKDLRTIADKIDRTTSLGFDYSLSGRNHPLQLFSRSDHYNFVRKDIPILCFTTGIHSDYHTSRDIQEKLDFKKMELITRTIYQIGFEVANRKNRLIIDNPFSLWGKSK
jgi:hypothetical protein